jgi:hypothetical protein
MIAHRTGKRAVMILAPLSLLLSASIEDQRARLPPAAEYDAGSDCSDPVVGVWVGQQYNPRSVSWQHYRLNIRRVAPGQPALIGDVRVHFWVGPSTLSSPPTSCTGSSLSAEILQNATGIATGNALQFGGNDWSVGQVFCGRRSAVAYNADHFQGLVNPALQEFQSVNNDGGTAVNEPVVFRRIECAHSVQPRVIVTPPVDLHNASIELRPSRRRLFSCARPAE